MKNKKICPTCKNPFEKPYKYSRKQFEQKIFCSMKCFTPWNKNIKTGIIPKSAFKKGQSAWNKGTKGIMKANNFSFKKGHKPSHTGKTLMKMRGQNNHRWNGGKTFVGKGYIYISVPNHPFSTKKGYVKRSRLIMEKIIDRYLFPKEVVHHRGIHFPINSIKNRQDDSPENLQLFANNSKHMKFHHAK